MIIQHAASAFLQKAFGYCIDADKKLDNPKESDPGSGIGTFNGHVQNKDGSTDVKKHAIKCILLPDLQQQVFFKEGEYLFIRIQKFKTDKPGIEEKCLSFEINTALFIKADAAITASGNLSFVCCRSIAIRSISAKEFSIDTI